MSKQSKNFIFNKLKVNSDCITSVNVYSTFGIKRTKKINVPTNKRKKSRQTVMTAYDY